MLVSRSYPLIRNRYMGSKTRVKCAEEKGGFMSWEDYIRLYPFLFEIIMTILYCECNSQEKRQGVYLIMFLN